MHDRHTEPSPLAIVLSPNEGRSYPCGKPGLTGREDNYVPAKPTVDEYLNELDHQRLPDIRRVRAALLASDADLGERIKWNAPSFGHDNDDRVTFRLQPGDRFEIVLHRGVAKSTTDDGFTFDDPDQLITWADRDRGIISVPTPMTPNDEQRLLSTAHRWLQATR